MGDRSVSRALSQRAYAKHRGCALSTVQKAIDDERITTNPDGSIDPKLADRQWRENTDAGRAAARGKNGHDGEGSAFSKARARREFFLAQDAELEFKRKQGKLVDADEVAHLMARMNTEARTKLLAIPSKLKSRIPHLTAEDVKDADALVREVLESLADMPKDQAP